MKHKYKTQNIFASKKSSLSILLFFSIWTSLPQQILSAKTPPISPTTTEKRISKQDSKQDQEVVKDEIIVKYRKNKVDLKKPAGRKRAENSERIKELKKLDEVADLNLRLVKTSKNVNEAIQEIENDPDVEFAEPNFKRYPLAIPNDTQYSNQWALPRIGAPEAWNTETEGQQDIVVAVIDTGVNYTHPDLSGNMWNGSFCVDENSASIPGGCPNHGWNMEHGNNDPFDIDSHGTFVAGVIGATSNNSQGISGTSFHNNIKIMAVKFGLTTLQSAKAINFAKNNGARVINASYGGSNFSQTEKNAIDAFSGIFVAAAGNEEEDNDTKPLYPASYTSSNIISVAATDSSDNLAYFSSYGAASVDLAAPGTNIRSADLDSEALFNEIFDSISPPSLPITFSNPSGQWGTSSWQDPDHPNDKYTSPGNSYNANTNIEIITASPIDTSSSEALYLSFYIKGDIESTLNCTADYLEIYTDNSDGNWVLRENYCGYSSGETISLNLLSAKSEQMRIKFLWHTNGNNNLQNFYGSPALPMIDDILLEEFDLNKDIYRYGSGTSFAAPLVAGATAMLFSANPTLSPTAAKNQLLSSGDPLPSLSGKTVSGKRLNLNNALQFAMKVETPIASTAGGTFVQPKTITLTSATPDATIFYTLDGSSPTTSSTQYSSPILISSNTMLQAIAIKSGFSNSDPSTDTYVFENPSQIFRFWSAQKQGHFYTVSESEKDGIIANDKSWTFEGSAFSAFNVTNAQLTPIYRFWSQTKQHHFYTASESEKDGIIANDKSWSFEGVAYYAYASEQPGTTAVYRFWSDAKQGHFYTTSVSERDSIEANDKSWKLEGIAWYVPTN